MKYFKVLLSLALALALAACGGGNKTDSSSSGSGGSTVALFTSAPATLSLATGGATASYAIGGGTGSYAVSSSNPSAVAVSLNAATRVFTVTTGGAGAAQVVVTDSAGAKVTLDVTVTAPAPAALFTSAPSAITVASGLSGAGAVYKIGGGVTPYSVATSNSSVALASISGGNSLIIYGDNVGTASIDVVDAVNSRVSISVTVSSLATVPAALSVLPAGASGMVGDTLNFSLGGGTAPYVLSATNSNIATLSAITSTNTGGTFTATLGNVGTTDVTLTDSKGQTLSFTITVSAPVSQMRLLPSALIVGENELRGINLNIYGGTPPYTALSSNTRVTLVDVFLGNPNLVQATPGLSGNRCVNPVDDTGVYVPNGTYDVVITVKDSLGATATSTMTIKDNGAGLGAGCP